MRVEHYQSNYILLFGNGGFFMSVDQIFKTIEEKNIMFVDFRFIGLNGMVHHITLPVSEVSEETFEAGVAFDGSSIAGFRGIEESDMVMMPDPASAFIDPFTMHPTLNVMCDIYTPSGERYDRDPRGIAHRAEEYLKKVGVGTAAFFAPESEFFVFDDVRFHNDMHSSYYSVDSEEAVWNSARK